MYSSGYNSKTVNGSNILSKGSSAVVEGTVNIEKKNISAVVKLVSLKIFMASYTFLFKIA